MYWVLPYMQEGAADIWKENMLEDLEIGIWEFEIVGEILKEIKKKFGRGDDKSKNVAKSKQVEQEIRIMEEYMQEFR